LGDARVVTGDPLKLISAYEYFKENGLNVDTEEQIINSIQGGNLNPGQFYISAYNYQSAFGTQRSVALAVANSNGTSMQVANAGPTKLYFNNNGNAHTFSAETLTKDRSRRGVSAEGPMTQAEESRNCIEIWQIPLIRQNIRPRVGSNEFLGCRGIQDSDDDDDMGMGWSLYDRIMVGVGDYVGAFPKFKNEYIRDPELPIRRTVHFYHFGDINETLLNAVKSDIDKYTKSHTSPIWDATKSIEQMRL
jgi:hypothetical protein